MAYIGRFAPSPTGPLHAGSLVAALASWLDARAFGGRWLVRIEDVDTPRCASGAAATVLQQLAAVGLISDEAPVYQSERGALYQAALDSLIIRQRAYGCACSRKAIETAWLARGSERSRHSALVYPGTCRLGLQGRPARAWRFSTVNFTSNTAIVLENRSLLATYSIANSHTMPAIVDWQDRRLGTQRQNVTEDVGDFVLKRADGLWAYQLAVVVDDAAQGVTHIVRGEDLADNTARQILLQRALDLPLPIYLHTPLVLGANGEKLSKQNGAAAVALHDPVAALRDAFNSLGLGLNVAPHRTVAESLAWGIQAWHAQVNTAGRVKASSHNRE